MKNVFIIVVAIAMTYFIPANAQDNNNRRQRQQNIDVTEIYSRQASRLVKNMKLSDEDKDKFTILYLDYQTTRHNVVNPNGGNQESEELRVDFKNLTDEKATELIQKNFERQEKQLAVDKEYLKKFLEFLTPVQAAQVFLMRAGGSGMRPEGFGGMRPGGFGGPRGGGFGGGPGGGFGGPGGF